MLLLVRASKASSGSGFLENLLLPELSSELWSTVSASIRVAPSQHGGLEASPPPSFAAAPAAAPPVACSYETVLTFEPPHIYAHTFQMTNIDEPPCKVTYSLTEKDGGTEFELIIENAVAGSELLKQMIGGQKFIASNLKALCETGKPAFTGRVVGWMAPVIAMVAKKSQRIEHWPLN